MSAEIQKYATRWIPTVISGAGVCLTAAQLGSQGITMPYQVVAGVVAGVVASILVPSSVGMLTYKISGNPGIFFLHWWGALSSGIFGVLAPLQARYGFVKNCFNAAHPALVGFSLGLTLTNLAFRAKVVHKIW